MSDIDDAAAARFHPELMRPSDDEDEVRILGYGYFDETEARCSPPLSQFLRSLDHDYHPFITKVCNKPL
jgi:hypothetical protein